MKLTTAFLVLGAVWFSGCRGDVATSNRFEVADTNNDRVLTQAELGAYVASNLFEGLDKNRDKQLSAAEWNAGGDMMTVKNFHKADANSDRVITETELASAAIRSSHMREFIQGADRNHDGGVTKGEAMAFYASKEGPR